MTELWAYSGCLICGDENPIGLNLEFDYDGEKVTTEWVVEERFEGFKGILHGGIITALMDEVMAKALFGKEILATTVELNVRFKKPISIGSRIKVTGWCLSETGRILSARAVVHTEEGILAAEGEGKFFRLEGEARKPWMASLEGDDSD